MPIFAALAAAGGLIGNVVSSQNTAGAINKASQAQQQAAQQGIGAIQGNNGLNGQLYSPYLNSGNAGLSQLDVLLGLGAPGAAPGVQQAQQGAPNWSAYVQNNPDVLAAFNNGNGHGATMDQFGQWHWQTFGQQEAANGNASRVYTPYGPAQSQAAGQVGAAQPGGTPQAQQQAAIDQLKASPIYQSLFHNGEQTVLADAAATGGLRGGNAQRSLYSLGNDTLSQVLQQQIGNLAGVAGSGQSAAGNLAGLNTNSTGAIAGLLGQQGQAQAGGIMGVNNANNSMISGLTNGLSSLAGNTQLTSALSKALGIGGGIKGASTFGGPVSLGAGGMGNPFSGGIGSVSAIPGLDF